MRTAPVPRSLDLVAGWSWRIVACAVPLVGALVVLWYVRVIVSPTLVALTLAPALMPLAAALRRRVGRSAAALALLIALALVAALVVVVARSIAGEYDALADAVGRGVQNATDWLEGEPLNLSTDADASLGSIWGSLSSYLVSGVSAGTQLITGIVIAVTMLYFVLRDGTAFWTWIVERFSPANAPGVDRVGRHAWHTLSGFIKGTAVIAAIDASLIGGGLWLLGVPLAFPLAILVFLGSFIPYVGAFVSGLIAVLVAFAERGVETAAIALAIVLVVQFIEGNFLQPFIQSRTVDLHPAVVLLSVVAGGSLFGILGAFLAVPAAAVAFAVAHGLEHERVLDAGASARDAVGRGAEQPS